LLIDEIGKERFTDSVEQNLYRLIEIRALECKPILWTSNLSGRSLRESMSRSRGPALTRRLAEFRSFTLFRRYMNARIRLSSSQQTRHEPKQLELALGRQSRSRLRQSEFPWRSLLASREIAKARCKPLERSQ